MATCDRSRAAVAVRRRLATVLATGLISAAGWTTVDAQPRADRSRPRIGVAFGGGGARGLAHVGVVRWFEEHRIPIDLVAGTSMGGLIGGAFASGMSAAKLTALVEQTDWNEMFGFSSFRFKNVRRKEDARIYPSRIELGVKRGLSLPLALNNGQQVDFLLARIVGPYMTLSTFDDLPTPFRAIAVDLVTAQQVVLASGSLATAMRATMSLPGVFPPVELDGQVLVDGGAMNNVPANVVRAMGADVVVAINVGVTGDTRVVSRSLIGVMSQTIDVMMEASTRGAMKDADILINPALKGFEGLDWRRSAELAAEGYRAADALKAVLLPLAVGEAEWAAYQEHRQARRKTTFPVPAFVTVGGAADSDRTRIERLLAARVSQPLDVGALETDLETLAGLDRYETVGWQLEIVDGRAGLRVDARPKAYAPPFLMLGINLQNTTRKDFSFQFAARYLTFDVAGSGSELRFDGAMGAQPRIGAELYRPIGSLLFVTAAAGAREETLSFVSDEIVVARYTETRAVVDVGAGVNLGRDGDVRIGLGYGRANTNIDIGDPGLPELHGPETRARLLWRRDTQDSPAVPSRGIRSVGTLDHILNAPAPRAGVSTNRTNDDITQAELRVSSFWSLKERHRGFLSGGVGTTWGDPLPNEQFQLGTPLRLGAYDVGEVRGDHYALLTFGYLRGIGRLPDFLGGPIFLGGWLENGSAFDDIERMTLRTNVSVGSIAETLVGPMMLGASFNFSGDWRYYVAIGRLF